MDKILQIKEQYANFLLATQNVVSVGIGFRKVAGLSTGEPCVVVGVTKKTPCHLLPQTQQVPRYIEGWRVDVQQVGEIRALQDRTGRCRPAPGGISIGHKDVTAGTLGCLVYRDGEPLILSNNHVLADSNRGKQGDPILQPGAYDGGTADDQIAILWDWIPVNFDVEIPDCPVAKAVAGLFDWPARAFGHRFAAVKENAAANLVDAAVAKPLSVGDVAPYILEIGEPTGAAEGELGMAVRKSGRTTGLTHGKITQVAVTVKVIYGNAIATFEDQLAGDLESAGGDSGSAMLDTDNRLVGLLFAGGEGVTIFNRWQNVTDALGVIL